MEISWKKFFSYFKFYFALILILAVVLGVLLVVKGKKTAPVRENQECTTTERVFDEADVLSETEEQQLRELIAKREAEVGCDIVLVTLNESLEKYALGYEAQLGHLEPYQYTQVYADNFYDEHKFGYNKPQGDGVLLLDNWYREADGSVYSWLSTCGKAEERFSESMIDDLLNDALENVDSDPFQAYAEYVDLFAVYMGGERARFPVWIPFLVALIAAGIYIGTNLSANKGQKTVALNAYVAGGKPRMKRSEDLFLRKTVTRRHIARDNGNGGGGGGGGGHHVSSGGVSHGGGGHSR